MSPYAPDRAWPPVTRQTTVTGQKIKSSGALKRAGAEPPFC
jgi:hypothetical protein